MHHPGGDGDARALRERDARRLDRLRKVARVSITRAGFRDKRRYSRKKQQDCSQLWGNALLGRCVKPPPHLDAAVSDGHIVRECAEPACERRFRPGAPVAHENAPAEAGEVNGGEGARGACAGDDGARAAARRLLLLLLLGCCFRCCC